MTDIPDRPDEMIVVPTFHYDVAYLKAEEEYYPPCWSNFREAIALMESDPEYRYMIEQPFLVEQFAARLPDDYERLKACCDRGQLEIGGALYIIPDMNMPSGESLIRQALFGRRWVRENLGIDVRVAWIADTWGHAPSLPQIMRHCELDLYCFTRSMRREVDRGDFIWVGIDGSEILTHWLPLGYAALRFPDAADIENALELDMQEATEANLVRLASQVRPYLGQETTLFMSGGDMAAPQPSAPAVMRAWQARGIPVRFGKVHEYADQLAANRRDLPRVHADFNPQLIGTQSSRIRLKLQNRRLENMLQTAERLHACAVAASRPVGAPALDDIWKICLKNQFHDTISGTLVDAAGRDALRDYDMAFSLLDAALTCLADQAGLTGIFNPSDWERTEWVEALNGVGTAPVTVPALGFAAVPKTVVAADVREEQDGEIVLENEYWKAVVGERGTLVSVTDAVSGQEFVREGGPGWGDLVYRNDNGDFWLLDRGPIDGGSDASKYIETEPDDPYRAATDPLVNDNPHRANPKQIKRARRDRAGEQTVTVTGAIVFWRNHIAFETTISLRSGDPLIHFETRLKPSGKHYRIYACFPSQWSDSRARHQIPFGAIERDDRRYASGDWVEGVNADGYGVRLLTAGTPSCAVNDGVISTVLLRSAAMEYKAESHEGFESGVPHEFRYAVRPITPDNPGHAEREAERINRPLYPLPTTEIGSGIESLDFRISAENVHLAAFYSLGDGEFLLRAYECAGREAGGTITMGSGISAAWVSDGMETRGHEAAITDGELAFVLKAWKIASWRIRITSPSRE